MYNFVKTILLILAIFILQHKAIAQKNGVNEKYVVVSKIEIKGNEKTKAAVIQKIANINIGDKIGTTQIQKYCNQVSTEIYNTKVFSSVGVDYKYENTDSSHINISIKVIENWLLFPSFIFELVDPSFNYWWKENHHDISRINVGLGLSHANLTGNIDRIRLKSQFGYTQKFELFYEFPYLGKTKKQGFNFTLLYEQSKNLTTGIQQHKALYYKDDNEKLETRIEGAVSIIHQQIPHLSNLVELRFISKHLNKEFISNFPNYYSENLGEQNYLKLAINSNYSNEDIKIRPTKGINLSLRNNIRGLFINRNINTWDIYEGLLFSKSILKNKLFYHLNINCKQTISRQNVPYNIYLISGVETDLFAGYEHYFLIGTDYANLKNSFRIPLFNFHRSFWKILSTEPKIRIRTNVDWINSYMAGYVWDKHKDFLYNKILNSFTTGLNVTVNSSIIGQIHVSVNHLKEVGLFFHTKTTF